LTSDVLENDSKEGICNDVFYTVLKSQAVLWLLSFNGWDKKEKKNHNSSFLLLGMTSLLWFLFRTGTKPTRALYPCQRAALETVSMSAQAFLPAALTSLFVGFSFPSVRLSMDKMKAGIKRYWKPILALVIILPTAGFGIAFLWSSMQPPGNDVILTLTPQVATTSPASDIYVLQGRIFATIPNLINLMGTQGLAFYQSDTTGVNQGPTGLIASNDVVLIKVNSQWAYRGGTNTDLLRQLIQALIDHPDGFEGEIVVADNGQGFGNMNWAENNAEDRTQSFTDVVTSFATDYAVNVYDWQSIRPTEVDEYSDGDMNDGYIRASVLDVDTGIRVTYPKFQTTDGTYVSFKHGIWNGTAYEDRLKVINFPILKSHFRYGVTGATKHYMGVQSEGQANQGGLGNGHYAIADGGMGTLLSETRYPVLTILDAIWINANPYPEGNCGPSTSYEAATRVNVLMASTDPIALDYWAAKHVLMQAAELIGYTDLYTIDPDSDIRGLLTEAFGVWLRLSEAELIRNGYTVTCDETRMNVYITQPLSIPIDLPSLSMFLKDEVHRIDER